MTIVWQWYWGEQCACCWLRSHLCYSVQYVRKTDVYGISYQVLSSVVHNQWLCLKGWTLLAIVTACRDLVIMELSDLCRSSISCEFWRQKKAENERNMVSLIHPYQVSQIEEKSIGCMQGIKNSQTQTEQVHTLN